MNKIYLHGFLKEKYSAEPIELDAATLFLTVQGLCSMFGDEFERDIRNNKFQVVRGDITEDMENSMGEEQVHMLIGKADIHIIPVIEGQGAVGRILIGAVLIIASVFIPGLGPVVAGIMFKMGTSMVLGGIMELLSPAPKVDKPLEAGPSPDERPSFLFNGPVNVMEQGGPVPLLYGRIGRCGSVVISAGISAEAY